MLQRLDSVETIYSGEPAYSDELASRPDPQSFDPVYYFEILKDRFFYFLGVFGLVSVLGLFIAAIQKPTYVSAGKILVQSQETDIVAPEATATASERALLIQHRVMTRDHLLSIASKFGLFPGASKASEILDLMLKRIQIKPLPVEPVDVDGQLRSNGHTVAFAVGFEYENPELAMRVANEFVTLIVSGDEHTRSSRTTEMVKLLTSQAKDIEDRLESTQKRILEAARRPRSAISDTSEAQRSQLTALATLKAELVQKTSVYSDAHPVVTALKKRIAMMEKELAQQPPISTQPRSTPDDDIEALKLQRETLEKQLAEANSKLASAHLREKLDLEQQDSMQVIEAPSLPEKPVKSKKVAIVGIAFAAATILGIGAAIGPQLLNAPLRSRQELAGMVASSLIVSIPYIATRGDILRTRLRILLGVMSVLVLLAIWAGLAAAIVYHLPIDLFPSTNSAVSFRPTG